MLSLNNLSPNKGARKARKRVGRGQGSGSGKTAGRGHKGARSRSGYTSKLGFERGQMPLHRRLPKRGFTNNFKSIYKIISLSDLDRFESGAAVNRDTLLESGIITKKDTLIKILANGEISKNLLVDVDKVSQSAQEKIVAAGGTVKE
jgi:large subunit ribosomal protein L15